MLIQSVQLENWKSYSFAKIPFEAGTTAILGPNGAGKSSILEAIGFCLFNHSNGKLNAMLREGAKEAAIEVRLVSSLDGCEYLVERCFNDKATTRYRVYGPGTTEQILAEGVAEVERWLRHHLGISPDADPRTLFSNTIGVAQGTFCSPFLLPANQRQAIFNPLLRVEEYKQASDRLLPTVRELKDQESALAQEIARMEGELTVLPGLEEEKQILLDTTLGLGLYIAEQRARAWNLESDLETLDAAQKRVEEADRQAAQAQTRLDAHAALVETARAALDEAEQAAGAAKENRPGYEAYREAEGALGEMEASRTERDWLLQQRGHLQTEVALLEAAREQVGGAVKAAETAKAKVQDAEAGLRRAKEVEAGIKDLDADMSHARTELAMVRKVQAATEAEIQRLAKQSDALADSEMRSCPLCESELTDAHKEGIEIRNRESIQSNLVTIGELGEQERWFAARIGDLESEMARCRSELRDLPSAADLERAQREFAQAEKVLEQAGNRVTAFAHAPQAMERLDAELEPFADLDKELARWQEQRKGHEKAHSLYLSNAQLAKQRSTRQAKVDEQAAQHEKLECERDRLAKEYLQAKIAYDATEHATVKRQVSNAQQKLAASKAQLEEKEYRLGVVRTCIGQLEGLEKELTAKTAAATETTELLAMTETVREILREAGPYVTRRLVRQISQGASTIFGDLMGDPARRLEWSDDYELTLDVRGHTRSFSQLSGGEQTCAALALRLGLLHETSSIDVAFFDEPTPHLDAERRESLAERIMQVKGFSQMFVISHDDTFQSTADSSIHIGKDEAGSHVTRGVGEAA